MKRSDATTMTAGPLAQAAVCTLAFVMKTSLSTEEIRMEEHFASAKDARDAMDKPIGKLLFAQRLLLSDGWKASCVEE